VETNLASIYLSLAVEAGIHFRKKPWVDMPRSTPKEQEPLDGANAIAVGCFFLAVQFVEDTRSLAETAAAFDAPAGSAANLPDFCAGWHSGSAHRKGGEKAPGWAARQAKNAEQRYAVVKKTSAAAIFGLKLGW